MKNYPTKYRIDATILGHIIYAARLSCCFLFIIGSISPLFGQKNPARKMELLSRGVVAVNQGDGKVFVGWRMLGTDADNIAFNLYRMTDGGKPARLNERPIADVTFFVDAKADLTKANAYFVRAVVNKKEQE